MNRKSGAAASHPFHCAALSVMTCKEQGRLQCYLPSLEERSTLQSERAIASELRRPRSLSVSPPEFHTAGPSPKQVDSIISFCENEKVMLKIETVRQNNLPASSLSQAPRSMTNCNG